MSQKATGATLEPPLPAGLLVELLLHSGNGFLNKHAIGIKALQGIRRVHGLVCEVNKRDGKVQIRNHGWLANNLG